FDISPEEAEALIMSARVKAGWVAQEELDALAAEKAAAEAAAQAEELTASEGLEGSASAAEASAPDTDATF
ncbi:MAG: transcription termination/antitermination protein NusA, partial [Pseudomonadota bacterium]|nr:transcription termination/antitermination protein NusA [Pseudomonadota bacterium]